MKVKVEPLLPTGNYLNVRIGIEKDFPDTANEMESVFEVWDNIIAMHMKRYPHLYNEKGEPLYEKIPQGDECKGTTVKEINPIDVTIQGIIEDINACTEITKTNNFGVEVGLFAYSDMTDKYPEIKEAYTQKFNELTKNQ
jgi:hypothetical protein